MLAQIHHQFRSVLLSIAEKGTLDFGLGYSRLAENKALKGGGTYCFRFQSSALIHSCAVNVFPIFVHFQISYSVETCMLATPSTWGQVMVKPFVAWNQCLRVHEVSQFSFDDAFTRFLGWRLQDPYVVATQRNPWGILSFGGWEVKWQQARKKWTGDRRQKEKNVLFFCSWYDHIVCFSLFSFYFAEVQRSADIIFRSLYNLSRRGCSWKGFLVLIRLGPAAFKVFMMQQTMDPQSIGTRTIIIDQYYMQLVGFKHVWNITSC